MRIIKGLLISFAIIFAFGMPMAQAEGTKLPMEEIRARLSIQTKPELGKWCDDIEACVDQAEEQSVPLLAAWGNASGGCGHCVQFIESLETPEFREWAASRKILMCYGDGKTDVKSLAVKNFTADGPNRLSDYPWVCIYWPKRTSHDVRYNFSGLISSMPVKTGSSRAGCLIASVEKYIKDYTYIDPTGGPVTFAAVDKERAVAANPYLYAKQSATIMLTSVQDGSTNRYEGQLMVSISAKNRITAKYSGVSTKALSLSGTWGTIDLTNGELVGTLEKSGTSLRLTMSNEGVINATFEPTSPFWSGASVVGSVSLEDKTEAVGDYVAILQPRGSPSVNGFGYLQLGIIGKATQVKGVLPDGTSLSGKFTHGMADEALCVPVFKSMSKATFAGRFLVADDLVYAPTGESAYMSFRNEDSVTDVDVFGGVSTAGEDLAVYCEAHGLSTRWEVCINTSPMSDSDYGEPLASSAFIDVSGRRPQLEDRQGVVSSLTYNKAQGAFTGKLKLTFESGVNLSGSFKGALVDPCADSNVVGYGTLQVRDSVEGVRTTRTLAVTFVTRKENK